MNLKKLRKNTGLTQEKLAELLEIHENTLRTWENGTKEPRISDIKRICEILKCSEADLLNEADSQDWNIEIKISKGKEVNTRMDLTSTSTAAILDLGDIAMGITLKAGYEIWEDDSKFEKLIAQLRRKRKVGLKAHKEDVDEVNE